MCDAPNNYNHIDDFRNLCHKSKYSTDKMALFMADEKHPGGRPTDFKEIYIDQVYKLALLGLKDEEIGLVFNVTEQTVNNWKNSIPEFFESLTRGKALADANVAHSLYQRACGYSHKAVKIMQYEGCPIEVEYTEHYPPDTPAATLWLKNRQGKIWRDKMPDGNSTVNITVNTIDYSKAKVDGD